MNRPQARRRRRNRHATTLLLALVIAAAGTAQAGPAPDKKHASQARAAQAQEALLRYLRCEGGQPNQFGELKPPLDAVNEAEFGPDGAPITVWDGIPGRLLVAAGYGFLVVSEAYPRSSRDALLRAMAARGWKLERRPLAEPDDPNAPLVEHLIAAHTQSRALPDRPGWTSRLALIEARIGIDGGTEDLDGLTVVCRYENVDAKGRR